MVDSRLGEPGQDLASVPGLERLNEGLYRGGGFLIEPQPGGTRLHKDVTGLVRFENKPVLAMTARVHGDNAFQVYGRLVDPRHGPMDFEADLWRGGGGGSTGLAPADPAKAVLDYHQHADIPLQNQLREAGFNPIADQTYRLRHGDNELTATVGPDNTISLYTPLDGPAEELAARSRVISAESAENWRGETQPALRLSNDWMDYTLIKSDTFPTDALVTRPVTAADVGVMMVTPRTEPDGFVVGGDNPTSRIEQLTEINGYRVEDLERWMRPYDENTWDQEVSLAIGSSEGFLGPGDSLLSTLARDNDLVRTLGLSHTDLAQAVRINNQLDNRFEVRAYISEGGHTYTTARHMSLGVQDSPFRDNTVGSNHHVVTNTTTGSSVRFSDLSGHMIERYGFYQGYGTSYRTAPEDIISVFGHLLDRVGGPERLQQAIAEVNRHHQWRG